MTPCPYEPSDPPGQSQISCVRPPVAATFSAGCARRTRESGCRGTRTAATPSVPSSCRGSNEPSDAPDRSPSTLVDADERNRPAVGRDARPFERDVLRRLEREAHGSSAVSCVVSHARQQPGRDHREDTGGNPAAAFRATAVARRHRPGAPICDPPPAIHFSSARDPAPSASDRRDPGQALLDHAVERRRGHRLYPTSAAAACRP